LLRSNPFYLFRAADFNQVEVMGYLVSKGAQVNAKDNYGITPLLAAVYENHPAAVKFLLENKADATVKGPDGQTPKVCFSFCNSYGLSSV
jgi:ankyrin repeat protein